jgi:hypothetical protein
MLFVFTKVGVLGEFFTLNFVKNEESGYDSKKKKWSNLSHRILVKDLKFNNSIENIFCIFGL